MKKEYEALSVDVVKFEAQDVITASNLNQGPTVPTETSGDSTGDKVNEEYPR